MIARLAHTSQNEAASLCIGFCALVFPDVHEARVLWLSAWQLCSQACRVCAITSPGPVEFSLREHRCRPTSWSTESAVPPPALGLWFKTRVVRGPSPNWIVGSMATRAIRRSTTFTSHASVDS